MNISPFDTVSAMSMGTYFVTAHLIFDQIKPKKRRNRMERVCLRYLQKENLAKKVPRLQVHKKPTLATNFRLWRMKMVNGTNRGD